MRGLFRFLLNLLGLAVVIFVVTGVWVVIDGLNDHGDRADCALVLGNGVESNGAPGEILQERLDKAADLYKTGKFPMIVVSGAKETSGQDEATQMARYLESKQVPAEAIIEDHGGVHTDSSAIGMAEIMGQRGFKSVMVVTHYYHVTRAKLALGHYGVKEIDQAHAGSLQGEDIFHIGREVVGIYDYLFHWYLKPAADKAKVQAEQDAMKAKAELQKGAQNLKQDAQQEANKVK